MGTNDPPGRKIKTTDTVFDIIELMSELDGATLTEMSDHLGLAKSTIHGHLASLKQREYVIEEDGEYYLSLKFLNHGTLAKERKDITGKVQSGLEDMATETGEVAWLIVEEFGHGVFLSRAIGDHGVSTHGWIGKRTHLHTTSAGKAILAHLSNERVEEIIEKHGLPPMTEHTITDRGKLFTELEEIREQGVAFNRSEIITDHRGVSSAIICNGNLKGAAGIAGPAHRLSGHRFTEEIPEIVKGSVNAIELKLEYS